MTSCAHYINGLWAPTDAAASDIPVINPATEQQIGRVPDGHASVVDAAVKAARKAFPGWAQQERAQRAASLRDLLAAMEARADDFADLITKDVGTPIRIARRIQAALPRADIQACIDVLEAPEEFETIGNSRIFHDPAGVVAAVTPWNFPLHQVALKLAPALAAGCTVVLKPSEVAPLSVSLLFELIDQIGFPPGVVNMVHGTGPRTGEALVAHPGVDVVSFTGSTEAGGKVAARAGAGIKRVLLELGGKSASIVLDDAYLETAVKVSVANCFLNGGQTCSAWTRLLVPAGRHDEVVDLARTYAGEFVPGDPFDPKTRLGPMVSAAQQRRVRSYIEAGRTEATAVPLASDQVDAPSSGYFVSPTVFTRVAPDARIANEEVFGPVLSIISFRDEDEAIGIANRTRYGLHGAVWSGDDDHATAVARRIRSGQIDINGAAHNPQAPFGGFGSSGIGREGGAYGIAEFLETKSVQYQSTQS